jgi:hypothetical protein
MQCSNGLLADRVQAEPHPTSERVLRGPCVPISSPATLRLSPKRSIRENG